MIINFNLKKLDKLIYDFYYLTGITVGIFDANGNQLILYPKEMESFCRLIKSSTEGNRRCNLSDKTVCLECTKSESAVTHYCHAGLLDTAVPIKYKNTILGYMMFGQIAENSHNATRNNLKKLSQELSLDFNDLSAAYKNIKKYDQSKIDSTANILKAATRYLWLSDYIELGFDTLSSQIDEYIKNNLTNDISVKKICDEFNISKNHLYSISHRWFMMPIGNYITSIRIENAKTLLTTTDIPISEIAARVGIKDYNYFTKFFKSQTGITPLKYRKNPNA
ncbi:MAG: PocR ligand-binding domain-containing protein [Clostridia bacterium]|nr:PocR ligand-binding domain-containing protein [Clostridia bacterium]